MSLLCKTQHSHFLTARLHVGTKRSSEKCLLLKRRQQLGFQRYSEKQDKCCFYECWTEWGHMCYKVPVCLCCKVQTRRCWDEEKKKQESSVYLLGSSGDKVQTSRLEEKPEEPLGWGTAKHLTLSSAGPHSSPPFIFVFSSIPGSLPSHHLSLEG